MRPMIPWKVLATVSTREGELQLRQRGEREFWITVGGRVLMTSTDHTSEDAVASLACKEIASRKNARVLIGGLGMAFTLRAALDTLSADAEVTVAELTAEVDTWCRGPLAPLTNGAALDPRTHVVIDDVSRVIAKATPAYFDAIVLDLYEGPHTIMKREHEPFYGRAALERTLAALSPGGVLAIWSESVNATFERRMQEVGFTTAVHRPGGVRSYGVYLGRRGPSAR